MAWQDTSEIGWYIEFDDNSIAPIGDDRVTFNRLASSLSAAGNVYNGGRFSCTLANYGKFTFLQFSLTTEEGTTYKMFTDTDTYLPSVKPDVLHNEGEDVYVKFAGTVQNGTDKVIIEGYFKSF